MQQLCNPPWSNQENKLTKIFKGKLNMDAELFELWLEFELWLPHAEDDLEDGIFNMQITLNDGRKYVLNVWTYKAIDRAVKSCIESRECLDGSYLEPPDLFVRRMDRELLEQIVRDLIVQDNLKKEWLVEDHNIDDSLS